MPQILLFYEERIKKKEDATEFFANFKPPPIFTGFLAHLLEKRMPPSFYLKRIKKIGCHQFASLGKEDASKVLTSEHSIFSQVCKRENRMPLNSNF